MELQKQIHTKNLLDKYIHSLTDKDYQGYMIAKTHLGSSFDLEKSIGFREWIQTQKDETEV